MAPGKASHPSIVWVKGQQFSCRFFESSCIRLGGFHFFGVAPKKTEKWSNSTKIFFNWVEIINYSSDFTSGVSSLSTSLFGAWPQPTIGSKAILQPEMICFRVFHLKWVPISKFQLEVLLKTPTWTIQVALKRDGWNPNLLGSSTHPKFNGWFRKVTFRPISGNFITFQSHPFCRDELSIALGVYIYPAVNCKLR